MPRKSPSFGQLLAYITIPERVGAAIAHNLTSDTDDIPSVHREFLDNYRYLPARKNGNVLYHEILSFSDLDQKDVTPSIVEELTLKYLDLRAPFALAYAQAHFETDCPHVHIMISANKAGSHRRLSLSRAKFARVKRDLEQYQQDRFPFLEHSVVLDRSRKQRNQGRRIRQRRNESERDRRLTKQQCKDPSRKQQIRDLVAEQLVVARSANGFALRLKVLGLQLYRRGKKFGVQDFTACSDTSISGRRYRLKTLGLEDHFHKAIRQWKVLPKRLLALEERELQHAQELWQAEGFQQNIRDVLALHFSELSPLERERLEDIQSIRAVQQEKKRDPPERSL